jgi:DNA/RNA endonuclease YhcR with UshA esterase domain
MSQRMTSLVCGAWLAGLVAVANAHHAQAPFFDQERTVEVRGTVVRWIFRNPHPVLEVEAPNEQGTIVVWAVQFAPATVLAKRGWTDQTFKPGDAVVATGHPSRAPGTYGLEHRGLERADGSPVVR